MENERGANSSQKGRVRQRNQRRRRQRSHLAHRFSFQIKVVIGFFLILFIGIYITARYNLLPFLKQNTIQNNELFSGITVPKALPLSANAATASASPSPSNTQTYIPPINYGRQVVVPVLYYHYIGNNPNPADKARDSLSVVPDLFDKQLGYLAKNGYTTITYDQLYAALEGKGSLPPKPILLTFDDGYIDFYINAFPIIQKYHFKATSFIPTGLMDQGYYLHWSQIKQMDSSGLISFEAHSVSHANLPSLNDTRLHDEVFNSKKMLESQLHKPVNFFAYPYGTTNQRVEAVVKQAGFLAASGTWYSNIQAQGYIFDLPRIRMGGTISMAEFAKKVAE